MMAAISVIHAPRDAAVGEKITAALVREGHAATQINGDPLTGDLSLDDNTAIVVWSNAAQKLARIHESARAALLRGALIPVAIGGAAPPREFKELPPVDLSGWGGDESDPRWRFVLEEINLAARRSLLQDGVVWADGEAPAGAPQEEIVIAASDAPLEQHVETAEEYFDAGAVVAPPMEAAPAHRAPGFQPRHVMLAASLALLTLTAAGALLAPVVFAPPQRGAEAPPLAAPVDDAAPATATLAFVKPVLDAPAPADEIIPLRDDNDLAKSNIDAAVLSPPPVAASTASDAPEEAAGDQAQTNEAGAVDDGPVNESLGNEGLGDDHAIATDDLSLSNADAPQPEEAAPDPVMVAEAATPEPAPSDSDAMENLVAAVTGEAVRDEQALAKLEPLPEEVRERVYLGNYFKECVECPDMAALPAGSFRMGSPLGELARHPSEGPVTEITLAKGFAIATREVTFEQWDACVADGGCRAYAPPGSWGRDKQPVVNVSFEDAQSYAAWLSEKTGRKYRLPSEAEWEYAARAGTASPLAFGDRLTPSEANYAAQYPYRGPKGEGLGHPVKVASYPPNAFGLFDMHGNVWEWTADCWAPNHANAATDGAPRLGNCAARVLKGGAFNTGGWRLRSAHRISKNAKARENDNGFRVARDLD